MNKTYKFHLTFPQNRGEYLIFSLPQTNNYQKINGLFIDKKYKIIEEKGNKIAIFTLNDVGNKITINFHANLLSVKKNIGDNFKIADYHNNLIPNKFISGRDKKILSLTQKIVNKETNLAKITHMLYKFALSYLSYGNPTEGLYPYKQAMEERITDCGGFSTFLASLLQSLNISSRLVFGFLIKDNILKRSLSMLHVSSFTFHDLMMHAWLEIKFPDNSWFPLDPSIEWKRKHGLTKREGGFGFIPGDRLVTSFEDNFSLKIADKIYQIDLLQKPIYL